MRLARPPSTAERRALASAAIFTSLLAPALKVGKYLFFGEPSFLDLASDGAAQHPEHFTLQLKGDRCPGAREENAGHAAAPCHQDGVFRPEQTRRLVSKLADCADSH